MKESRGEGLATPTDPESCVDGRKAGGETLTGARTGQPLSCEKRFFDVLCGIAPYGQLHLDEQVNGKSQRGRVNILKTALGDLMVFLKELRPCWGFLKNP